MDEELDRGTVEAERDRYYGAWPREGRLVGRCEMTLPDDMAGKRVLDLGCRRGKGACKIADRVGPAGRVLGVDPSPACIEAARAYAQGCANRRLAAPRGAEATAAGRPAARAQAGSEGALGSGAAAPSFACAPFEDLRRAGIADGSFDVVYVNSVLNLAWDRDAALREIVRALAPGGALHFAGVFAEEPLPAEEARAFAADGNVFGAASTCEDFEAAALRAGFARCEIGDASSTAPDGDDMAPALEGRRFAKAVARAYV